MKFLALLILSFFPLGTFAQEEKPTTYTGQLEIAKDMFVLVIDKPITASGDFGDSATGNRLMLAGYDPSHVSNLKRLVGQRVEITGLAGAAFSPHHTEDLVLIFDGKKIKESK